MGPGVGVGDLTRAGCAGDLRNELDSTKMGSKVLEDLAYGS